MPTTKNTPPDSNGHRPAHRFQPGRSGNPAGRAPAPKDVREALQAKSERFVKVKNSWGAGWADKGFAWLSEEYIGRTFISLIGMA